MCDMSHSALLTPRTARMERQRVSLVAKSHLTYIPRLSHSRRAWLWNGRCSTLEPSMINQQFSHQRLAGRKLSRSFRARSLCSIRWKQEVWKHSLWKRCSFSSPSLLFFSFIPFFFFPAFFLFSPFSLFFPVFPFFCFFPCFCPSLWNGAELTKTCLRIIFCSVWCFKLDLLWHWKLKSKLRLWMQKNANLEHIIDLWKENKCPKKGNLLQLCWFAVSSGCASVSEACDISSLLLLSALFNLLSQAESIGAGCGVTWPDRGNQDVSPHAHSTGLAQHWSQDFTTHSHCSARRVWS